MTLVTERGWDGYFINLERSQDRRRSTEAQLEGVGLTGYRRFAAIDGRTVTTQSSRRPGEIGVFLSHLNLLRMAAGRGRPIHVIEDDVILSDLTAGTIQFAIASGTLNQFDIIVLETYIGRDVQALRGWRDLLKDTRRKHWPITRPDQLRILDATHIYRYGTTSYIASPAGMKKLVALLDEEWRRGPSIPVDTAVQAAARAGRLRIGCIFPFVTSLNLDLGSASQAGRDEQADDAIVQALLRYSFYVRADMEGFAAPGLRALIARQPESADELASFHADVLGYYLRRPS